MTSVAAAVAGDGLLGLGAGSMSAWGQVVHVAAIASYVLVLPSLFCVRSHVLSFCMPGCCWLELRPFGF